MKVNFINNFEFFSGEDNMAKDSYMLEDAINNNSKDITVRFYGWKPKCISLGRNQKEFILKEKIDIVKRPTGGRALLHDKELTYCVVCPCANMSLIESYRLISQVLIAGFNKIGIKLELAGDKKGSANYCMNISSGADICYNGKKFIGSAQFRKQGYFLQHGSILFDADFKYLEQIFGEKIDSGSIITLKKINPEITCDAVIAALKEAFIEKFGE